jgi:hypothetical protein
MTNLEGALREIREALAVQLGASEHRKDFGEFYLQGKTALAKLDAILDAVPEGWVLSLNDINELQMDTIAKTVAHAKRAHEIDIIIRKDGKETRYEGDWIKHLSYRIVLNTITKENNNDHD